MLLNILENDEEEEEEDQRGTDARPNFFEEKFALFVSDETIFREDIIIFGQG